MSLKLYCSNKTPQIDVSRSACVTCEMSLSNFSRAFLQLLKVYPVLFRSFIRRLLSTASSRRLAWSRWTCWQKIPWGDQAPGQHYHTKRLRRVCVTCYIECYSTAESHCLGWIELNRWAVETHSVSTIRQKLVQNKLCLKVQLLTLGTSVQADLNKKPKDIILRWKVSIYIRVSRLAEPQCHWKPNTRCLWKTRRAKKPPGAWLCATQRLLADGSA